MENDKSHTRLKCLCNRGFFPWRRWCLNGLMMAVMKNDMHRGRISHYNTRVLLIRRSILFALNIARIVPWHGYTILRRAHCGTRVRFALLMHEHDDWMEASIVFARARYDLFFVGSSKRWWQLLNSSYMPSQSRRLWLVDKQMICKSRWLRVVDRDIGYVWLMLILQVREPSGTVCCAADAFLCMSPVEYLSTGWYIRSYSVVITSGSWGLQWCTRFSNLAVYEQQCFRPRNVHEIIRMCHDSGP